MPPAAGCLLVDRSLAIMWQSTDPRLWPARFTTRGRAASMNSTVFAHFGFIDLPWAFPGARYTAPSLLSGPPVPGPSLTYFQNGPPWHSRCSLAMVLFGSPLAWPVPRLKTLMTAISPSAAGDNGRATTDGRPDVRRRA